MTSANLLARLRTLLDESAASFWTDAECYAALSDGQREVANITYKIYDTLRRVDRDLELPKVLRSLITAVSASTGSGTSFITLAATAWLDIISIQYNHTTGAKKPVLIRRNRETVLFQNQNTYMADDETNADYWAYISYSGIIQLSHAADANGTHTVEYLAVPTEIASATDPILPDMCVEAILHYGFAELLKKDQKLQEANQEYNIFIQLVQNLVM